MQLEQEVDSGKFVSAQFKTKDQQVTQQEIDEETLQTTLNPALIKYFAEPEKVQLTKSQQYLRSK